MMYGAIFRKYVDLGGELGVLSFPTSDITQLVFDKAVYVTFNNGIILINNGQVLEVDGEIYRKWLTTGGIYGRLGLPMTNAQTSPDGNWTFNWFEKGMILQGKYFGQLYALRNISSDAQVFTKWVSTWKGGPGTGDLGFPTSDTLPGPNGGIYSVFERGAILWSPTTGMHMVKGVIYEKYWNDYNGPWGRLGYPKRDEVQIGTKSPSYFSTFQNGQIDFESDDRYFFVWDANDRLIERPANPYPIILVSEYGLFEFMIRIRKPLRR